MSRVKRTGRSKTTDQRSATAPTAPYNTLTLFAVDDAKEANRSVGVSIERKSVHLLYLIAFQIEACPDAAEFMCRRVSLTDLQSMAAFLRQVPRLEDLPRVKRPVSERCIEKLYFLPAIGRFFAGLSTYDIVHLLHTANYMGCPLAMDYTLAALASKCLCIPPSDIWALCCEDFRNESDANDGRMDAKAEEQSF